MYVRKSENLSRIPDKTVVDRVNFYRYDGTCTPGCEFITDRSGSGKEIENFDSLQVPMTVEHVEQVLFGEIGGRSCSEIFRGLDRPSLLCAANDSHGGFGLCGLDGDSWICRHRPFC